MEQLLKAVAEFAGKLGIEAARLWPEMVLVYWAKSFAYLVLGPPVIAGLARIAVRCGIRADAATEQTFEAEGVPLLVGIACGVLAACLAIVYVICFVGNIAAVFRPEASLVLDAVGKK